MADFRKRIWTMRSRPSTPAPRLIDEEIIPSSGWTQFPEFHCLLVDLPGFRKDEIKFNVDDTGTIVVSGKRIIAEGRQVYFKKSFSVPEDGDIKNISTQFEGDTLRVSVPKVPKGQKTNGASIRHTKEEKGEDDDKLALALNSNKEKEEEEKRKSNQSLSVSNSVTNEKQYDDEIHASSSSNTREEKIDADNNLITDTKETAAADSLIASSSDTNKEDEKKEETGDEGPASSCYSKEEEEEEEKQPISNDKIQNSEQHNKTTDHQKQNIDGDQGSKTTSTKGENTSSSQTSVMVKIVENKGILIASILSFTLGFFLSQKFHQLPPPK